MQSTGAPCGPLVSFMPRMRGLSGGGEAVQPTLWREKRRLAVGYRDVVIHVRTVEQRAAKTIVVLLRLLSVDSRAQHLLIPAWHIFPIDPPSHSWLQNSPVLRPNLGYTSSRDSKPDRVYYITRPNRTRTLLCMDIFLCFLSGCDTIAA
jgi:hypothetical protein